MRNIIINIVNIDFVLINFKLRRNYKYECTLTSVLDDNQHTYYYYYYYQTKPIVGLNCGDDENIK